MGRPGHATTAWGAPGLNPSEAGSSSTAQPLAGRDPAACGTPGEQRGADELTAPLCPQLTPGFASRVKRKRVSPRGSALCIFLRSHVIPSVPVRGGRHVVQNCCSPEGWFQPTPAQPAMERPERHAVDASRSEHANGSRESDARVVNRPASSNRQVCVFRPPAHAPTVHMLQDRFFSRRPNGRLRLARKKLLAYVVTEEAANDSSSKQLLKPIRVLPNHTYLLLQV